ncbi:helix-turn-helix transcriptional regulator [Pseudactinotalea suaedae]|uniref:helix-turn-helix transcriptional regulator n=1 Tax=Pseudactinotalea suaedae TaxID=1524924 RepID=UPI001390C6C7|nr:LuxR family transcriptional regulator [Pseudactinotalea suaedae]
MLRIRSGPTRTTIGLQDQRAALIAVIDRAREGSGRAVMVRGPRGSGKTHLLEAVAAQTAECMMLRASGVEVESGIAYGTVQQLCGPVEHRIAELPRPQAEALATALALTPGLAPEPSLVGLALVSLLTNLAEERPVVCVLDAAEWIDDSSARALGVAARRLAGLRVALLLASSSPATLAAFAGVDEMWIHPLSDAEAGAMLDLELFGRLDPDVRDRVIAETRGNPLVVRQLARSTSSLALAGGFRVDTTTWVDAALDARVTARVGRADDDAAFALLLAAAEPLGDVATFHRAVAAAGLPTAAPEAAVATELLTLEERVLFRHPLMRHLVYRSASETQRRRAHAVLATAVENRADHAAWHRARAWTGQDERLAASTERSRSQAERAGGVAAAAAFLNMAATLSEHPGERSRRALEAARLHARGGAFDDALRLVADLDHRLVGSTTPATAYLVTAEVAASIGHVDAAGDLLAAAHELEVTDPVLSASVALAALEAAAAAGRLGAGGGVLDVARHARSLAGSAAGTAAGGLLRAVVARWSGGGTPDHAGLARALAACRDDESAVLPMAVRVAMELRDEGAWVALTQRQVDLARRSGELARLPRALDLQGCLHLLRGEVALAASSAEEAAAIARRIGAAEPVLAPVLMAAWRSSGTGQDDALEGCPSAGGPGRGGGPGGAEALLDLGRAMAHTASGRYEQALCEALRVLKLDEPFVSSWAVPEVVEAAVRAGRPDLAAHAIEVARSVSDATGSSWALGVEHRCLALLADDGAAEAHFDASVRHLVRAGMRLDLARTQLLYGEWLRRQTRRVDARTPLRQALEVFEAAGAAAFATRASLELRATGEQARRRTPDTLVDLTEREAQVAALAVEGLSNPEIGMQLFISARTVEYHLHKVFAKLGITSRAQLRAALPPR